METIIIDSGPLYASLDDTEEHHVWAVDQLRSFHVPLLVCDSVLTETCFLLSRFHAPVRPLRDLVTKGFIDVHSFSQDAHVRIFELMEIYRNVPISFADACIVTLVEENPGATVFTLDRDFTIYRQHRRRLIRLIAPFSL